MLLLTMNTVLNLKTCEVIEHIGGGITLTTRCDMTCKYCNTTMSTGIALVPEYDNDRPGELQLPKGKIRKVRKCKTCGYTIRSKT